MEGATVNTPGRTYANPPRESVPGPKSRSRKYTLGSDGAVSWGLLVPRPALKSSTARPPGFPSALRGMENSLKSRSPNWNDACAPVTDGSKRLIPFQDDALGNPGGL